jgi:hypothetical protein
VSETVEKSWEVRLRELLNGILSRRLDPLASELNTLQTTLDGLRGRLVQETRAAEKEALEVVAAELRHQLAASEQGFAGEREVLRGRYELSARTERALLNSVIADIDRQRTQAGVLAATILGASSFASRVALFVVRSGNIVGWRGTGFGQESDDASLSLLSVPMAERSLVGDALSRRQSLLANSNGDPAYLAFLGVHRFNGVSSAAVPLIVRDKPAAVLYADTTREDGIDVQPLEAIVRVASMAIELLPLRRSIEPFTTELPSPRVLTASLDISALTGELDGPPPQPAVQAARVSPPIETPITKSEIPAETSGSSLATADLGANGHVANSSVPDDLPSESAVSEATEVVRATVAIPEEPSVDPGGTDPRSHLNARRYARFLIGQIKLYQPSRVAEGCRRGDLYDRLREEIESSRRLYERHVPRPITSEFDYFYHELVINLAEGDATKLGRNFPAHQS